MGGAGLAGDAAATSAWTSPYSAYLPLLPTRLYAPLLHSITPSARFCVLSSPRSSASSSTVRAPLASRIFFACLHRALSPSSPMTASFLRVPPHHAADPAQDLERLAALDLVEPPRRQVHRPVA